MRHDRPLLDVDIFRQQQISGGRTTCGEAHEDRFFSPGDEAGDLGFAGRGAQESTMGGNQAWSDAFEDEFGDYEDGLRTDVLSPRQAVVGFMPAWNESAYCVRVQRGNLADLKPVHYTLDFSYEEAE